MAYYDQLKNKIRPEDALPEGYGFDDMKDGIYSKMPAKEEKRRKHFLFWWLFPVVGLLSIGWMYLYTKSSSPIKPKLDSTISVKKQQTSVIAQKSALNVDDSMHKLQSQPKVETHTIQKANKLSSTSTSADGRVHTLSQKNGNFNFGTKSLIDNGIKNNEQNKVENSNVTTFENTSSFENTDIVTAVVPTPIYSDQSTMVIDISTKMIDIISDNKLDNTLTINTLPNLFLAPNFDTKILTYPFDISIIPIKAKPSKKWNIELGGGFFAWQSKNFAKEDIEPNANTFISKLTPNFGYNVHLCGELVFNHGWYLTGGLDAMMRNSYFTYSSISTKQVVLADQVVKIEQNLLTGTQNQVLGNANAIVNESHRLQRNISDMVLKIPLIGGYSINYDRWSINAGLGLSANVWSQHKGVTVAKSKLVTYNGDHPLWNPIFQLNFESQLKLKYHLNDRIYFGSVIQYSKVLSEQLLSQRDVLKPTHIGASLMIGFTF